ncbi:MAG: glycosyl hydrolase family 32 [Armatimonadota bacterium]|nr:MAG: glycosyl hydrolase family 32 [Armatimonadota bacterium]
MRAKFSGEVSIMSQAVLTCTDFLVVLAVIAIALAAVTETRGQGEPGQTLYNGIQLPSQWPPQRDALTLAPPPKPPYLVTPPDVIPIDVGRQLFVDDFLIQRTTLKRTYHLAEYHPATPVLKPDRAWEAERWPTAMVFSDGVWYDPQDRLFKMWYMGGYAHSTCYATSRDGIHWEKPALDIESGTNVVHTSKRDSGTAWLDLDEQKPERRYKMFLYDSQGGLSSWFSSDGIHWSDVGRTGPTGDRTTVFYNPFREVWVYGIREYFPPPNGVGRCRRYWEHPDVLAGAKWEAGEPTLWVGADKLDPRRADLNTSCELYNLDAVAYESIMLGLFSIWRGQPQDRAKPNEVCVGFTRDGFHWYRPDRRAFIPVSENYGDWNWANVQSAGGCCLVVGDELWFYVSGRAGERGSSASGVSSTGLAMLRRDGFASMDADESGGTLTTRRVRFSGKYLFVNADADGGELRVEVLDEHGRMIRPFTRANCVPISADKTLQAVHWKGAEDLSAVAGKPVKLRFRLTNASLYAFWVSPEKSGASRGYVAAGGPGFTGPTDTVGAAAYGR